MVLIVGCFEFTYQVHYSLDEKAFPVSPKIHMKIRFETVHVSNELNIGKHIL